MTDFSTEPFPRWPLWASLFACFLLTAALIAVVPPGAAPDEAAHWQYVEHIALTGQLPVFRGQVPPVPGYEFHQPPLYYLLCAPVWKVLGPGVQNYGCRAVSLFCGLATIALIWSAARLIYREQWRIAALSAAFAALWPLHQGVGAISNNDGLGGLIGAALFFLIARFWISVVTWRDVWQLGFVTGLAILTKNTLLVVAATAFAALFFAANRENSTVRPIGAVGAALGISLVVGGAWLMRNNTLYGDPFALGAFSRAATAGTPGFPLFSQAGMSFLTYARGLLWMIFLTFWGFFGGPNAAVAATAPLNATGPHVPQLALAPLMMICLLAPLAAFLGFRRLEPNEISARARPAFCFWLLGVTLVVLAWLSFAYAHFSGGQARYLHSALLPFCVLGAAGWVGCFGQGRALKFASLFFGSVLILLTLLNVFVWKTLV